MVVVGSLNAHGNLDRDADRLFNGKPGLFFNILLQSNAFHQFHDNIINIVLFAYIIDIHHIRMCQTCRRLCLHLEFGNKIRIFRKFLFQHFDRHVSVQLVILRFIYVRHSTGSNFFQYFIPVSNHHSNFNHFPPHLQTAQ